MISRLYHRTENKKCISQTEKRNEIKARTHNKRFGVSRGVCSQKVLREFESLSPVRTLVFPHPNAKPPTVGCNLQKCVLRKTKQE